MNFGEKIKYFAKTAYGSQTAFATIAEISVQRLNDYVAMRTVPSMEALQKMRNAGLSLEWLLAEESEVESISMYANNETGRNLYKQATGKDWPQRVDVPLNADTKEVLRQNLLESLKLLG